MDRRPVESTMIRSVGYDPATKTLEVEFQKGGVYQYFDVSQGAHDALVNNVSPGGYFKDYIKGSYTFQRMT